MDNLKLAKAVACLLPDENSVCTWNTLCQPNGLPFKLLAFECHKALVRQHEWCKCDENEYLYGEFQSFGYSGEDFVPAIRGSGDTDEQAIFAAVQDAYDKREGV